MSFPRPALGPVCLKDSVTSLGIKNLTTENSIVLKHFHFMLWQFHTCIQYILVISAAILLPFSYSLGHTPCTHIPLSRYHVIYMDISCVCVCVCMDISYICIPYHTHVYMNKCICHISIANHWSNTPEATSPKKTDCIPWQATAPQLAHWGIISSFLWKHHL